ncbi:ribosome biogenesis regulatory protein homolog [Nephila pilipes]|uniref:Ribosome biogenesis regulatory protein n=1 Tax=Nephila pilipes TaxID=299642 RepID=A0A8X6NKJ7_NEPPI|nr:ribosome biogenesis regulatory protein homolog [Nephila pilipes]
MAEHEVDSEVYVELDVGNLCITNIALLKSSNEKNLNENVLQHVAALGAQKLISEILKLPSQYHEHVPVAKLPQPTTVIPREKPVPKPKAETKWEKFAKDKGIKKTRRDRVVWDSTTKDWKPRFGYQSIKNKNADWIKEIPDNGDQNIDYFAKAKEEKKERIAKNEYQRLRNIAVASKVKVTNLESVDRADKHQLARSLKAAKTATASLGRYTKKLTKERAPKDKMKPRQFNVNIPKNIKEEKEHSLKIFETMEFKTPKLNIPEAVQRYMIKPLKEITTEQRAAQERKRHAKRGKFLTQKLHRGKKKNHHKR